MHNSKRKEVKPMSNIVPDLSWGEIAANIEQLKQANIHRPTAVTPPYLEEIEMVNDALRWGVTIAIRVASHHFTCLPSELHPIGERSEEWCQLVLKKVVVEFRQERHTLMYRITLRFWDSTHEQEVVWGATTIQPQWATIVQQARNEEAHCSLKEDMGGHTSTPEAS